MNRIIGAILLAFSLTGLTACSNPMRAPVSEEAVVLEPAPEEPVAGSYKSDCITPGPDDGIGGTGCKVDAID